MDHICDSTGFVGAGIANRLHVGRRPSRPAGHRNHCDADPGASRTKTGVARWTVAGRDNVIIIKGVSVKKKRRGVIGCLVLILFLATFAACASTSKQEGTGEYLDDSVITARVKSMLAADDFLKSFQIGVETYKSIVQLSGFVNSQKTIDKAAEITRGVKGVESVKNDLVVK